MHTPLESLYAALKTRAAGDGIEVVLEPLGASKAALFDGVSITLNSDYDLDDRCYYLAHSLGSIVLWSLDPEGSQRLYDDLRAAKKVKTTENERFEKALASFRRFEEAASEYAVDLLAATGNAWMIPAYTSFFRADLEAITVFHRTGKAPVWLEFFADWKRRVSRGEQVVAPYVPKPIPPFKPVRIAVQEVLHAVSE